MKIAQVGPLWENIPPDRYGGTERIVSSLTEGLVKKGHDVTLFACGTSKTSAKLVSIYPRPLFRDNIPWTNVMYPLLNITEAFDNHASFDIIHVHLNKSSDYIALPLAKPIQQKVIFTLHFPYPYSYGHMDRHAVMQKYKDLQYISISDSQRLGGENLNWQETIYNGVDINRFTFNEKRSDYYLWIGKFNPDKGTKEAIISAKKMGVKLLVGGAIDRLEGTDFAYYNEEVKPLLDDKQIVYIGELSDADKNKIYEGAIAFINPIRWNEPFGLVMAEAQAVGCPVISYANGAAPELIKDGVTGFLVNESSTDEQRSWITAGYGIDGLCEAINKINSLTEQEYLTMRHAARAHVEKNFTVEKMVDGYEKVYEQILNSELRVKNLE